MSGTIYSPIGHAVCPWVGFEFAAPRWMIEGSEIRLFRNDYTPDRYSDIGDFIEPDYTGYAAQPLIPASWALLDFTDPTRGWVYPTITFEMTGNLVPNEIYGWWIDFSATGTPVIAGRFDDGPIALIDVGDRILLVARYSMRSLFD